MKKKSSPVLRFLFRTRAYLAGFLVIGLLFSLFYLFMRRTILQSYQSQCNALALQVGTGVAGELDLFCTMLSYGCQRVDLEINTGADAAMLDEWFSDYYAALEGSIGQGIIDPYMVFGGQIIAANPWEGDNSYDYASTAWYQQAIAAEG
ncbi:MAG: hypothetical protein MSH10_01835 [Pygmaiobacter massiliensis]|nr:hypothetical protein [Pygmaiobacter massiliensis]